MGNSYRVHHACAVAAALFLAAGCDSAPRAWSRDDITAIAEDAAADAAADYAPDTSDLEERITTLEQTIRDQESEIRELRSEVDAANNNIETLWYR